MGNTPNSIGITPPHAPRPTTRRAGAKREVLVAGLSGVAGLGWCGGDAAVELVPLPVLALVLHRAVPHLETGADLQPALPRHPTASQRTHRQPSPVGMVRGT